MTDESRGKDDLLAAILNERGKLEAIIAPLGDAQITIEDGDGWSVKDHLSHIGAWERMIVAHLTDGSDAAVAGMDAQAYEIASLDELNARLHDLHRAEPIGQVRVEFAAAHAAITAFVAGMAPERLAETYWRDDPSGRTVMEKIAGDTYLHYAEHAQWIGEMLARTGAAR